MATESSSIDELLASVVTGTPAPEYHEPVEVDETVEPESLTSEASEYDAEPTESEPVVAEKTTTETADEYGNEPEQENEVIRERLARQARKHEAELAALKSQLTRQQSQQVQQAADKFEYNPDESGDWQQQLASFVKQTVQNMGTEQQRAEQQQREMQAQMDFETKFRDDVQRFPDFEQAIMGLGAEISDPMVHATRSMTNPAAFLYAAAKRAPAELQRISKLQDPYAQIAAIGALEANLRQTKPATKAPRPIGKGSEDGTMPHKTQPKGETIEDLIKASEAKIKAKRVALRR